MFSTYWFLNSFWPIGGYSIFRILLQIFPQVLQHWTESSSNLQRTNVEVCLLVGDNTWPTRSNFLFFIFFTVSLTFFPVLMLMTLTFSLPVRGLSALLLLFLLLLFTSSWGNNKTSDVIKNKTRFRLLSLINLKPRQHGPTVDKQLVIVYYWKCHQRRYLQHVSLHLVIWILLQPGGRVPAPRNTLQWIMESIWVS